MISLYAFLDETGDRNKDDRIFVCGYVGSEEHWSSFSSCWKHESQMAGLGENQGIHATELLSQSGDFFGWDAPKADDLVAHLVDVIRSTIPIGIAVGFDTKHYRTFSVGLQNKMGRPLIVCMSRAIDLAVGVVTEMRSRGDDVAGINLTFDDSEKDAVDMLRAWIQLKKARPKLIDSIPSVGFADDKRFYPLQAADLLGNLTNRYWKPQELSSAKELTDRAERHLRNLLTPDPAFQFAYRAAFVTAEEMDEAARLHKRLY